MGLSHPWDRSMSGQCSAILPWLQAGSDSQRRTSRPTMCPRRHALPTLGRDYR